jgi:hypothetical protein
MWMRNLLFLGLVLGGVTALGAALFPLPVSSPIDHFDGQEFQSPEFRSVVERVNALFQQQWADLELKPAPRASDLTIARRLSLALTGTIPSLQEIRSFESQAVESRVPWYLALILHDPRYADYWAERFARAYVGTEDGPFLFYRRRRFVSWLSDELLKNTSYGAIVRDMITAKGLWTDKPATNFLTVTYDPEKKTVDPERLAGRVARAGLGIRLDCAQCHNHPFAKWKRTDFQGMAAFFGQTKQGFTGIYDGDGEYQVENPKTGTLETVEPKVPDFEKLLPDGPKPDAPAKETSAHKPDAPAKASPLEGSRRQRLAEWLTDPRNPHFARATVNRVWALLFGRPLAEPVDDVLAAGEIHPVLQLLADDFAQHQYDLQRLIRLIAATEVFQLDSASEQEITDAHEKAWAAFPMTRLRPEQVVGSISQAASLETLNRESHILLKFIRFVGEKDFVQRYGDTGEDEFDGRGGTIPQRLLLMNGNLVHEKTREEWLNAATRIGRLAPNDRSAVETAYLAVLTRRPAAEEAAHFEARLAGSQGKQRDQRMEDLYWILINSSECSWNH